MRCAKSYQDIESPDDYKDNSDYFEEFIEKYVEKWGEQSDEDYDIIHLYWYTIVTDYLDESILDMSVNEMRESLVWYFKCSAEDRLKDIWVLQEQIRKMKCCGNCKHSRTEYEHCKTDKHEKWEIKEND